MIEAVADKVFVYVLHRRFVDEQDVPEEARQVMYYSLAIGHHLGVVDCLNSILQCSRDEYRGWLALLPSDTEAHRKMAGFLKFGEIAIYQEHINMLAYAFDELVKRSDLSARHRQITDVLLQALTDMHREPNMYLMVRSR